MRRALAAMLCASETNKAKCSEGLATAKKELQKISSKASDLYTELEATHVVAGSMGEFSASQQIFCSSSVAHSVAPALDPRLRSTP